MGEWIDGAIDADLEEAGCEEMTAKYREGDRKVVTDGGTYLRPTIVYCESFEHPLSNREFRVRTQRGGCRRRRCSIKWANPWSSLPSLRTKRFKGPARLPAD